MSTLHPPTGKRRFSFLVVVFGLFTPVILSAQPLNGTYTVGGSSPDYATLSAAVGSLTANGVSGPVFFNIAPGTYQEQVSIPAITGTSATNTVTFQSSVADSSVTIIRYSAANDLDNYVFELDGANYIRIRYLTLQPQNVSYQKAIRLKAGASNNVFSNNIFRGTNNSPNDYKALIHFYGWSGDAFQHNTISYNRFEAGGYQLWVEGITSGNAADNRIIGNDFTGHSGPAISIENQQGIEIRENTITGAKSYPGAIVIEDCTGSGIIGKNKVDLLSGNAFLMTMDNVGPTLILNNFFAGGGCSFSQTTGIQFFNNSCYFTGSSAGFIYLSSGTNSMAIFNNAFSAPTGGSFIRSYNPISTTTVQCDYNTYYSPTALPFEPEYEEYLDFGGWQAATGFDMHSILTEPQYFSTADMHMNNTLLPNGAGTPLPEVTEDIDGEPRDASHPDIGADEYSINMATFRNLEMVGEAFTILPCTPASSVRIRVANHSAIQIDSFTVVHHLFGVLRDSAVYTIALQPNDTTIVDLGSYTFVPGTLYDYDFTVTLPNGLPDNNFNDNEGNFAYSYLADAHIHVRAQNECSTETELFVRQQPLSSTLWSTGETTPSIVPPGPGTYDITITHTDGCSVTDSYTLN